MKEETANATPEPTQKPLSEVAKRALDEAQARRKAAKQMDMERQKELQGREGPDPIRYGDWENKGIASDF